MAERITTRLIKRVASIDGTRFLKRSVAGAGALALVFAADYAIFTHPAKQEIAVKAATVSPPPLPEDLSKAIATKNKFIEDMRDPFFSYQVNILRTQLASEAHTAAEATLNQHHLYNQEFSRQFQASGYKTREVIDLSSMSVSAAASLLGAAYLVSGWLVRPDPAPSSSEPNPPGS